MSYGEIIDYNQLGNEQQQLIKTAVISAQFSYSPYSKFKVGAAIKCEDGTVFTGCNIENISFTPGICAERTAIAKAVSEGYKNFKEIAIVADDPDQFTTPCGVCRQVIVEFCTDIKIYLCKFNMDKVFVTTIQKIFPLGFSPQTANINNSNKLK